MQSYIFHFCPFLLFFRIRFILYLYLTFNEMCNLLLARTLCNYGTVIVFVTNKSTNAIRADT